MDVVTSSNAGQFTKEGYSRTEIGDDLTLVTSKDTDSLPITTLRIDFEPCVEYWKQSSAPDTQPLPNEIVQVPECEPERNTGLTIDERFSSATHWSVNELDMMKENGVYHELYNEEPEKASYAMGFSLKSWTL